MKQIITIGTSDGQSIVASPSAQKHEFLPRMRESEGMSTGQRETVRRYNSMWDFINNLQLMEEKAEK